MCRKTVRTKSRRGGKSRLSRRSAASTPPPVASPSFSDQDAPTAEGNTLNDGFASCKDVLNAEDNTVHEASRNETNDVLDNIDCFQKDTCIRCDKSGDLLVCTEIGCPIALHELCMSCEPSYDEEGRFYCPYCSYKRALVRVNESRRNAMVAKRALSNFVDTRMVGGGNLLQIGEAGKKKASNVSTRGVDANQPNHGSHWGNDSSRDQDTQIEQNQSNEKEDHARIARDVQATSMVRVIGENHDGPIVSNISKGIYSTPEVQPCEDSMNEEETREADTLGTHQVESLEDEDGEMMDEENLRSTDNLQEDETAKNRGQSATTSPHRDGETAQEPQEQDKDDGGEQIHPNNEGMLEDTGLASGNNDLKDETIVKKKRFKIKANRRSNRQKFNSPRKSLRLQTSNPGKDHATKIEKVSASRNLRMQPASRNQLLTFNFYVTGLQCIAGVLQQFLIIKEGVHRFSSTDSKNVPWKKILEFGHHVFDNTRTPGHRCQLSRGRKVRRSCFDVLF
ncbi:hypothetical protein SDJN02_26748 [Cucurbita argyrosperma subsp. argyrosperma]|nr:hypothetical protein SDJN02_26748 [Cucurbita argyrosperma subsp. argyrosperma]